MPSPNDLNILLEITGPTYLALRTEVVRGSARDPNAYRAFREDPSWQKQVLARILEGWTQHAANYEKALAHLDGMDVESAKRTVLGLNYVFKSFALECQRAYGPPILPLAWEVILKFHATWPEWKILAFIEVLKTMPDQASFEPLTWLVAQTEKPAIRYAAAEATWKMPPPAHDRIRAEVAKFGAIQKAYREAAEKLSLPIP